MNKKYLYKLMVITFAIFTISSCEKNYLDVNTDPNNPTEVTVDLVLPNGLGSTAYDLGNGFQILGGLWGQIWTQGPTASQYRGQEQYSINNTDYDNNWQNVFSTPLINYKYLVDEGMETGRKNYAAIGKIMMAYSFQYMTDLHGDIPFSEALQAESGNIKPKYDSQQDIYDGLIKLADEGIALIDENTTDHPGADDLLYHGDMTQWRKFAQTLKLKIYLRQAYVRPAVAEAGIKAMYSAGATFLSDEDEASVEFTTTLFNQNPLFSTFQTLTTANLIASNTALQYLIDNNDPRVDVFYTRATAAPSAGNHAGINQGNGPNLPGNQNANSYSKPGPAVGGPETVSVPDGGADAPVIFMSAAESYFLQAEAVVRGWGTGNAENLYNKGIESSFERWGFTANEAEDYRTQANIAFPAAGSIEQKIKSVIFQKWVSFNGTENLEAWTEWRRTGYPDIFTVSLTSSIGNKFPVRILYPDSEVSRNPNTPPQKAVTDKVWWDVNTTGQN